MINWNKGAHLMFYPFGKLTKELEAKCEYSLPFSGLLTTVEVSKCNSLIAVATHSNSLVVFDLNSGTQ